MNKRLVMKRNRYVMLLGGGIMLAAGLLGVVWSQRPGRESGEKVLYSYTVKADSDYRVRIAQSELYQETWLEAGKAYPGSLTKELEITVSTLFSGSEAADVEAVYEIKAIVEGYQNSTGGRAVVYRREYPLKSGSFREEGVMNGEQSAVISLKPEVYRNFTIEADRILQTNVGSEMILEFSGTYWFRTPHGEREEPFTYSRVLPIVKGTEIYEIAPKEALVQEDSITTTEDITVAAERRAAYPFVCLSLAGVLLLGVTLLGTRSPNAEETAAAQGRQILKKYASRMIVLKNPLELTGKEAVYLAQIDQLMVLAEELQKPVCYCLDEQECVADGKFFAFDRDFVYIFQL